MILELICLIPALGGCRQLKFFSFQPKHIKIISLKIKIFKHSHVSKNVNTRCRIADNLLQILFIFFIISSFFLPPLFFCNARYSFRSVDRSNASRWWWTETSKISAEKIIGQLRCGGNNDEALQSTNSFHTKGRCTCVGSAVNKVFYWHVSKVDESPVNRKMTRLHESSFFAI